MGAWSMGVFDANAWSRFGWFTKYKLRSSLSLSGIVCRIV
jgi:hypothetical protein